MHLIWDQKTNPNSFYNTHTSHKNLEHAQSSAEMAIPSLKKTLKKWKSNSGLEAFSKQKLNATPFPGIQWSNTNQNQAFSLPKTHCKSSRTNLWTWIPNLQFLHLFFKILAYLWLLFDLECFGIIQFDFHGLYNDARI